MNSISVKYNENAYKLKRKLQSDAGYDISSSVDITIPSRNSVLIPTGVFLAMPDDIYCRIAPRSGLAYKHKLNVHAGVIDSNYRGELKVLLFNHSDNDFKVIAGDRIAQLVFTQLSKYDVVEVDSLDDTSRGDKGFGSSGLN